MESVVAKSWGELDESNIWREYRTVANGLWDQGFYTATGCVCQPNFPYRKALRIHPGMRYVSLGHFLEGIAKLCDVFYWLTK
jgi:hypothetical protein